MRGKRLSLEQQQSLKELYPTAIELKDIAKQLNCSITTIGRWRKRLNIPRRVPALNTPTVRPYALAHALWVDNETMGTITRRYGFPSRWALKAVFKRAGIPTKYLDGKLRPNVWSRLAPSGCLGCNTTKRSHEGRGLCNRCYHKAKQEEMLELYPTEAEMSQRYTSSGKGWHAR